MSLCVLLPIWLLKELDHDVYPKKYIQDVHGHNINAANGNAHANCTGLACPYDRLSYTLVCLFVWLVH